MNDDDIRRSPKSLMKSGARAGVGQTINAIRRFAASEDVAFGTLRPRPPCVRIPRSLPSREISLAEGSGKLRTEAMQSVSSDKFADMRDDTPFCPTVYRALIKIRQHPTAYRSVGYPCRYGQGCAAGTVAGQYARIEWSANHLGLARCWDSDCIIRLLIDLAQLIRSLSRPMRKRRPRRR